jgi:hypothetical protein
MHLAQLNIGRFRYPTDDPRMAEFMENLDLVNGLAERAKGFVWRLKGDNNNATGFRLGDNCAVNLSVWETAADLEAFVFKTVHVRFYKKREAWFDLIEKPHFVMWWIAEGHIPTLGEAQVRLADYAQNGPSDRAFGWSQVMDDKRVREVRCA